MRRLVFTSLAIVTFISILLTTIVFAETRMIISGDDDDDEKRVKVVDVRNPYIGIYMDNVTRKIKKEFDYPKSRGVWIMEVVDDSPADNAGLERDDIIYMIDGERVSDVEDLKLIIEDREAGDTIDMVVFREGEKKEFRVELGEKARQYYTIDMDDIGERLGQEWGKHSFNIQLDDYKDAIRNYNISSRVMLSDRLHLGVQIHSMSDDLAEYFDVKDGEGVLVLDVIEDSPAEKAGMKGGDVIVAVNDIDIEDGDDLLEVLGDYDEDTESISVTVIRKGNEKVFDFDVDDLVSDDRSGVWISGDDDFKYFKMNVPSWSEGDKLKELRTEGLLEEKQLEKLKKEIEILEKRLKKLEKDKD